MKNRLVLFDFDGTLFDTSRGIIETTQKAFAEMGFPVPNEEDFRNEIIGPPLEWTYTEILHLSKEDADKTVACFRVHYPKEGIYLSTPYPGLLEMLQKLKAAGVTIAIASSKPTIFIEKLLTKYDLTSYFTAVSGITIGGAHLTKGDVIRIAMEQVGAKPEAVVMVGDRKYDMIGAREQGVISVGATYGFGSTEELRESGADYLADSIDELCKTLFKILNITEE